MTRYNRTVRQTRTRRVDYAALAEWRYQLRLLISRRETAARAAGIEPQQYVLLLQLKGLQDALDLLGQGLALDLGGQAVPGAEGGGQQGQGEQGGGEGKAA